MAEAVVLVLDIGRSVGNIIDSKGVSFFENAKLCASMVVQRKIFSCPKDEVSLILLSSENTNNPLDDGEGYQHIEIVHSLQRPNWTVAKTIASYKTPSSVDGDWLDGLVVAMDHLRQCSQEKNFTLKKIALLTNFRSDVSDDEFNLVVKGLKNEGIEVIAIGPDVCDSYNEDGKSKSADQKEGEKLIAAIVTESKGALCSFKEALPQLMRFERRRQRSVPWRAVMEIGSVLKIPVVGYIKVSEVKRVKTENIVLPSHMNKDIVVPSHETPEIAPVHPSASHSDSIPFEENNQVEQAEDEAVPVERDFVYTTLHDNPAPVDVKDIIEGYMFGSTIIPVSEDDKKAISYQSGEKCFSVLGFTHHSRIPRKYFTGTGCMLFFAEREENTMQAFSALLQAMHSKDMVAIVRKVYRKNTCPQVGALFPVISEKAQHLIYVQLPFSQDMRTLVFPPLMKENDGPSKDQLNAVDQLIDSMDLLSLDEDAEDPCAEEPYCPEITLDPTVQHYYHFVARKIMRGGSFVNASEALETVREMLAPLEEVLDKASLPLKTMKELFPLKEIKPKEGTRRAAADEFKCDVKVENIGLISRNHSDVSAELNITDHPPKIGTLHPTEDFLKLIAKGSPFNLVCSLLQTVITEMVDNAFDEDEFHKPFKALITLRKECISRDPAIYNDWLVQIKDSWLNGKNMFWNLIVTDKLGLICSNESDKSSVTSETANAFISDDENQKVAQFLQPMEEDLDDLINQM